MGVVYEACNEELDKRVAIKRLGSHLAASRSAAKRFLNEARAAARSRHPGIIEVFDIARDERGDWYIVMEYLEGESLAARLRRTGKLAEADVVRFARQAASALQAAHDAGVVHRDLEPDNVFLVKDPDVAGGERVKLLDFGIAKMMEAGQGSQLTQTGALIGTPPYMSPEQCRGIREIDHRSDLYSLGIMLFEMLAVRLPFKGDGPGDFIVAHLRDPAPSLQSVQPGVSAHMDAIVARLLAKEPDDRFSSATALLDAFDRSAMSEASSMATVASSEDGGRAAKEVPLETIPVDVAQRMEIVFGDITEIVVDAIVNATDWATLVTWSAGLSAAIHRAAGPELTSAWRELGPSKMSEAKITAGYNLPAGHVIHVASPPWIDNITGAERADRWLADCYRNSLELLVRHELSTIAFPCMSVGLKRFPVARAARIALTTVATVLSREMRISRVIFCCYTRHTLRVYQETAFELSAGKLGNG